MSDTSGNVMRLAEMRSRSARHDAIMRLEAERDRYKTDAERLAEALREVSGCTVVVKDGPDGEPMIYVRRPESALDFAVETARAALATHEADYEKAMA